MGDFNWNIWFEKLGKGSAIIIGATVTLYVADYIIENPLPPEYAFWGGLIVIILQQMGNFIKHKYLV